MKLCILLIILFAASCLATLIAAFNANMLAFFITISITVILFVLSYWRINKTEWS